MRVVTIIFDRPGKGERRRFELGRRKTGERWYDGRSGRMRRIYARHRAAFGGRRSRAAPAPTVILGGCLEHRWPGAEACTTRRRFLETGDVEGGASSFLVYACQYHFSR
jgi:hypothetical protein